MKEYEAWLVESLSIIDDYMDIDEWPDWVFNLVLAVDGYEDLYYPVEDFE